MDRVCPSPPTTRLRAIALERTTCVRYDTVYGRYHREVSAREGMLVIDGRRIPAFSEHDPENSSTR